MAELFVDVDGVIAMMNNNNNNSVFGVDTKNDLILEFNEVSIICHVLVRILCFFFNTFDFPRILIKIIFYLSKPSGKKVINLC